MKTNQYTKTAIVLHWLIAIGIFAMFALGWYMADLPKNAPKAMSFDLFDLGIYNWQLTKEASPRSFYFNLHKSVGVTLLGLIVLRVLWRITHRPPAFLLSLSPFEMKVATIVHQLLYALMFVMPLSGLLMALNSKYGVKWFGIRLFEGLDNPTIREFLAGAHGAIGASMLTLTALHLLGAIKHRVVDKDDTMGRMSISRIWHL